jgi:spore coat protein SA
VSSIAIVVPELLPVPPVLGGAVEHWVDEVASRMAGPGRRIAIVSRPAGVAGRAGIDYIGIPWTATERLFHRFKERATWRNPLRYAAKIQNVFSYARRVARAVRGYDVVYVHNEPNVLLFLRKRRGQTIVLHMHNDHLSLPLFGPLYRHALGKADRVVCVSDYIRRQAVRRFPEHAHRFSVVFNATDPRVFMPYGAEARRRLESVVTLEPGRRYLLYVGRLAPIKGVHVLIEAFRDVHRRMPDARLLIAGSSFFSGAARTAYEDSLVKLAGPLEHAIAFTGFLPHEQLKYLYAAVDVIVLPSVWDDPCPLVALEAMASGTCLVSSAVGGVPEVVDDCESGVLVAPNSPPALAEALCAVLADPERKRRLEHAARAKIVAGYSWEQLVPKLEAVLGCAP